MNGYKLLDEGFINEYGFEYELGKTYCLVGDIKWNYNGFHFCTNIEDTLRYRNKSTDTFVIVEVEASGDIVDGSNLENDYYGYETGYASTIIKLTRVVSRSEMINMVLDSKILDRVKRLIISIPLTKEEIDLVQSKYPNFEVKQYIDYYQHGDKETFYKMLS